MTWRHFKIDEFACHHCGLNLIAHDFVDKLDELRERLGFPLPVSSGYRCPEYNKSVSETGMAGPHTSGRATDFLIDRRNAYLALKVALEMGFTGIGVNQKGATGRFLHLDDLQNSEGQPRPTIWSY